LSCACSGSRPRIAQELRRSLVFYREQSEGRKAERFFFLGGGSCLKNFLEVFSGMASGSCETIKPFSAASIQLPLGHQLKDQITQTPLFANAASLAFGLAAPKAARQSQINFLPVELKQKEAIARARFVSFAAAACVLAVILGADIHMYVSNQAIRSEIKKTARRLEKIQDVSDSLKGLEKQQRMIQEREALVEKLLAGRIDLRGRLKDVAAAVDDRMLWERVLLEESRVTIDGAVSGDYEEAQEVLAGFKKRLEGLPFIGTLSMPEIELEPLTPELAVSGAGERLSLTRHKERKFTCSAESAPGQ